MRTDRRAVALLLALLGGLGACAPLQPWERGTLVSEAMRDPGEPGAAGFDSHVRTIHESADGASGTGSVSCGCN
jgi:Domain of unknown function (DUF4266)